MAIGTLRKIKSNDATYYFFLKEPVTHYLPLQTIADEYELRPMYGKGSKQLDWSKIFRLTNNGCGHTAVVLIEDEYYELGTYRTREEAIEQGKVGLAKIADGSFTREWSYECQVEAYKKLRKTKH